MKNKKFILPCLLAFLGMGVAHAGDSVDSVYAYVQKVTIDETTGQITKSDTVTENGTACFDFIKERRDSSVVMEFDADLNAVMSIDGVTVAKLKPSDWGSGGALVGDFTYVPKNSATVNELSDTVSNVQYATLYSPFRLKVQNGGNAAGIEIYAPSYNEDTHQVVCNSGTKVTGDVAIPAGTALVLQNEGIIKFDMVSNGTTYDASNDALTGTAIGETVSNPTSRVIGNSVVFTLGKRNDTGEMGFFRYTGTSIRVGSAYLVAKAWTTTNQLTTPNGAKSYIAFSFDDDVVTGIDNVDADVDASADVDAGVNTQAPKKTGKFFVNGRVVIFRDGHMYNLSGQEVR